MREHGRAAAARRIRTAHKPSMVATIKFNGGPNGLSTVVRMRKVEPGDVILADDEVLLERDTREFRVGGRYFDAVKGVGPGAYPAGSIMTYIPIKENRAALFYGIYYAGLTHEHRPIMEKILYLDFFDKTEEPEFP